MTRFLVASCLFALAACSTPATPLPPAAERAQADAAQARLCADPTWKARHLGLWYDVCRKNAE